MTTAYSHRLAATALALAFALSAAPVMAEDAKPKRTMTMTGSGEVKAKPDLAFISSGVITQARTAGEALVGNTAAMARVIKGLKAKGIADKDLQTTNFSIQPRYHYDKTNRQRPPQIIGYQVSNQIHVTIRDITRTGDILDAMAGFGANSIGGIRFGIANPKPMSDAARKRAMADAMRKARIYAGAAEVKLGAILSISESNFASPRPRAYRAGALAKAAEAVPVQPGQQSVNVRVNVIWEIE